MIAVGETEKTEIEAKPRRKRSGVWWGILAPARTPREIVNKLHGDVVRVLQMTDTKSRLAAEGVNPFGSSPEQFSAMIRDEIVKMEKIVKAANVKID